MRKIITLGIMLLFLGMTISSSTGLYLEQQSIKPLSSGNILYVGGSGPNNYTKIQDAIDNASEGDTVLVYNGKYKEDVVVNKSITLMGKNKNKAVIDGEYEPAITVTADGVVIYGFMITDGSHAGIKLQHSDNNKIYGNNIIPKYYNIYYGIALCYSEGNEIYSNTIISYEGIHLNHSNLNIIHNNSISNGEVGIRLQKSNMNSICYNAIFEHNPYYVPPYGKGIIIEESNFTNVAHNIFYTNDGCIFCIDSDENNIVRNIFSNNEWAIFLEDSDKNNMSQNIFLNTPGIYLEDSDKNNISQNIFSNDSSIYLDSSYSNVISYNNLDSDTYVSFGYSLLRTVLNNPQTSTSAPKILFPNNNWNYNYWGESRILPKLIWGHIGIFVGFIPWINFDWHPASEPYDIGV